MVNVEVLSDEDVRGFQGGVWEEQVYHRWILLWIKQPDKIWHSKSVSCILIREYFSMLDSSTINGGMIFLLRPNIFSVIISSLGLILQYIWEVVMIP